MNVKQLVEPYLEILKAQGWRVSGNEREFGVYRTCWNGKPRNTPDVLLWHVPLTQHAVSKPSPPTALPPFRVDSRRAGKGRRFAEPSEALAVFLEECKALAPNDPNREQPKRVSALSYLWKSNEA